MVFLVQKKNEINKGRGFRKKLLYISRGLILVDINNFKKKFSIFLNECWDIDLYEKKIKYMKSLEIEKNYNNKIKNILIKLIGLID